MNRRTARAILALVPLAQPLAAQQARAGGGQSGQQGVDYRIEARLEEGSDILSGRARLRYTNR